jgi:hypothetical protein
MPNFHGFRLLLFLAGNRVGSGVSRVISSECPILCHLQSLKMSYVSFPTTVRVGTNSRARVLFPFSMCWSISGAFRLIWSVYIVSCGTSTCFWKPISAPAPVCIVYVTWINFQNTFSSHNVASSLLPYFFLQFGRDWLFCNRVNNIRINCPPLPAQWYV